MSQYLTVVLIYKFFLKSDMFIFHVGTVSLEIPPFMAFNISFLSAVGCDGSDGVSAQGSVFVPAGINVKTRAPPRFRSPGKP